MTQLIQAGKQLLDIANSVQYTSAGKVVLDSAGAVKFLRAGKLLFDNNGFLQYIKNGKLYVGKDATLTAYSSASSGKITTSFEDARVSDIYVPDHEGVLHAIPGGTVAFEGARVVDNKLKEVTGLSSSDFSTVWSVGADAAITGANRIIVNSHIGNAYSQAVYKGTPLGSTSNKVYSVSIKVKSYGGTNQPFRLICTQGGVADVYSSDLTAMSTYQIFNLKVVNASGGNGSQTVGITTSSAEDDMDIVVDWIMFEDVTGQSNQNPSEYVPVGTGLPGIAFYTTQNGNTVDANGVVTEAVGAPITTPIKMVHAPAATNLITYSSEFDNAAWIKLFGSSVIANSTNAPDGNNTADLYRASTSSYGCILRYNYSYTLNIDYTLSVYVKKSNHRYIGLRIAGAATSDKYNFFDFDTEIIDNSNSTAVLSAESGGNGWYRLSLTYAPTSAISNLADIAITDNTGFTGFTPTGTEEVYIWGAQLEQSAFSTPLIPTSGASVSRDICHIRAPYAGAFNQAEGVAYFEWEPGLDTVDYAGYETIISTKNSIYGVIYVNGAIAQIRTYDGTYVSSVAFSWVKNARYHLAVRWKTGGTLQVGFRARGAASWTWASANNYDGSFITDELFVWLLTNNDYMNYLHNLEILNKDIGTTAIEDRYSLAKVG